jgi:type IV pilus assembly protein PilV
MKTPSYCRAFSLLEVMVAVLILSIGLLGIAGLQATAKRTNFEAMQRTTATMLAQEIIERMRNNPGQLDQYIAQGATIDGNDIAATSCGDGDNCGTATLVTYDLNEWEDAILGVSEVRDGSATGGLTSPTGCISQPAGSTAGTVSVAIAWRGLTPLSNPTSSTCGQDAAGGTRYSDTPGDNVYRRILVITTFINS